MRQHRLVDRSVAVATSSFSAASLLDSTTGHGERDGNAVDDEPLRRDSALVRRPAARAYRLKKETSICGLTCSCCYHTILKPLRQKMNVRRAPNGVSRNSSTNEDVAENSETIIHSSNDTELSTSQMMSDLQLDQSVLASIGERLSRSAEAEHSRSITPINLSRFDGFCSPGCSLITLESRGEKIQFAAKQPRSKSMTTTPEPSTICNSDETPKKSVIRRASSVSEDHSARSSASKKSSASSESGTPVRIPIVKQRRIYIVKRMTPEVSDDEESKDVPSVSEEPTSLEPLPKRMKLSEMGMESEPIEIIKPIISPVTQVDSAENAASDGEASTEINSATLPSTPLDAAENEQLSETAHRSPVLTDGMGEEDSEVTPRITRTPVKGDTIRGEDSEEAPRITRTPAKADSMRDEDSEVAPTITRSPAKADAMAEEDSEVPPRITRCVQYCIFNVSKMSNLLWLLYF